MRFLLGGLFAGLILNLTGIALVYFFLQDATSVLESHFGGFPAWTAMAHLTMRFAAGIALLWVFVATRSRVDHTGIAIAIAVLVCWVLVYPPLLEIWIGLSALRGGAIALSAVWGLAELSLAAYLGWLVAGRP